MKTAQANNEPLTGKVDLSSMSYSTLPAPPPQILPPLVPITKETWKSFSPKQRWDVMTAMRGPDFRSGLLKYVTTGALRLATRDVLRQDGTSAMINKTIPFVVVGTYPGPMGASSGSLWGGFDAPHFFGHVVDAANILGIPVAYTDPWAFHKFTQQGMPSNLLNILGDPFKATLQASLDQGVHLW